MRTRETITREDVELIQVIKDIPKSRTQMIRIALVSKQGQRLVSLQKWWRKSPDEKWTEGKGFHLTKPEISGIVEGLTEAADLLAVD